MIPLWLWTAFAGLAIGMIYAWRENRNLKRRPLVAKRLTEGAVEEITALLAEGNKVRAIKLLRVNTGITLLDAKNRVDDWRPDEEYEATG
ncbi:MAG: hypothetical protein ABIR57_01420 [Aeromicrobium sp.]